MNRKLFKMGLKHLVLCLCIFGGIGFPLRAQAQKVLSTSEKKRPAWLSQRTPNPGNDSFEYQIAEGEHRDLEEAKHSCLLNLSTYLQQSRVIKSTGTANIEISNKNGDNSESESYNFTYNIEGDKLSIHSRKYDEYWEYILYPNGERVYRCYTLFGVAKTTNANFDQLIFTRKYGARGLVRSLFVPGWGQLYKGNTTKGACILGGEVLLIGGIIAAENLRSSYVKKMHEDAKHLKSYNTKADNWENIRNVCIGGAAALYVYNIVDALVANGRKRSITHKKDVHFSMYPTAGECNGVSFVLNF